jgi:hypothetical protein
LDRKHPPHEAGVFLLAAMPEASRRLTWIYKISSANTVQTVLFEEDEQGKIRLGRMDNELMNSKMHIKAMLGN